MSMSISYGGPLLEPQFDDDLAIAIDIHPTKAHFHKTYGLALYLPLTIEKIPLRDSLARGLF